MHQKKTINVAEIKIRYFVIFPQDIVLLKAILESYEGMVVVRTVESDKTIIELLIAHDFQKEIDRVLEDLQGRITMSEISSPGACSP